MPRCLREGRYVGEEQRVLKPIERQRQHPTDVLCRLVAQSRQ